MASRDNVLFLRMAADLDLVASDSLESLLQDHGHHSDPDFEQALLGNSLLTPRDLARVRAAVARLLERHGGDAARAIAELAGEHGAEADVDSMDTLAGAPAHWRVLSEEVHLSTDDAESRYVDPVEHGRGGMGRILIVRDERMNRAVAMKELVSASDGADVTVVGHDSARLSTHHVQRFLREARITGSLEHPSIIPVYELGVRADGCHYYTMKLVRGQTLHQAIHEAHGLTQRLKLLPHVVDLCQAIAYAHDKGIVHRDIKPSNVMVGSFGETVVIDWGLARVLHQEDPYAADLEAFTAAQLASDSEDPALTLAGLPVGTPHYMAPEQAEGRMGEVGTRSDVYSLGVVLYEVITGRTPFTGTTSRVVLQKVRTSDAPSVTSHEASIPPALAAICARAMARDPAGRYASAGELAEDLTRFTTGALVKGHDYTIGELIRHYYRRHRALSNTVLAAAAVTLVVAVASYVYILDANRREREQRVAADAARVEAEGSAYRAGIQLAANYVEGQQFDQASALLLEQPAALRNWEWGFLFEQCNQDYATNTDHETPVHNLSYATGGRLLTLGFQDHLAIRSLPDLAPLHRISVADATGALVVVSPDGSRTAIVRTDGRIPVYSLADYRLIHEFRLNGLEMNHAIFSGDGRILAVGVGDGTLYMWDCDSGTEVGRIAASEGACEVFGVDPRGTLALTGDQKKGSAILWDIATGAPRHLFAGDLPSLSAGFERVALRSGRVIQVYDVASGALLFDSGELAGNIAQLVIGPDGRRVVAWLKGGQVVIWDTAAGGKVVPIRDLAATRFLSFSPDGTQIALAVEPHAIEIRRTSDGERVQSLMGHSQPVVAGAFDEDGRMFYSCAGDRAVKAWRLPEADDAPAPESRSDIIEIVQSNVGSVIGAGDAGGVVHFLDAGTLEPFLALASFDSYVRLAISPAGDRAAVALGARTVQVFGLPGGELLSQRNGDGGDMLALAFSDDGRSVVSLERDCYVRTWDSATGSELLRFDAHQDRVVVLDTLEDGRMVTGDRSGRLLLWDGRTGTVERELRAGGTALRSLDCSLDGQWAAAAFEQGTAELYPLGENQQPRLLSNANLPFDELRFSDDGSRLTGAIMGHNFKLWDVGSGQQLAIPSFERQRYHPTFLLDSKQNHAITFKSEVLTFLPSFPRDLYSSDPISAATIRDFKRGRAEVAQQVLVAPKSYRAFTTAPVLREAMSRLERLAGASAEGPYQESSGNPLARLGFRPGDSIVQIDGLSDGSLASLQRSLQVFASRQEDAQAPLKLTLTRSGSEIQIEHQPVAVAEQDNSITFSHARALELLKGTQELLLRQERFLVDYSQRLSNDRGAGLTGTRVLAGAWIPRPATREEESILAEVGLNDSDCIVAVNDTDIVDYTQFLDGVSTAIDALEAGVVGSIRLRVERDRYQLLNLTWSVL